MCRLSLVVAHELLLWSTGSRECRISSCNALASLVAACGLSCPGACGIFLRWTMDQTQVPCIGRQILNHWTTREVSKTSCPRRMSEGREPQIKDRAQRNTSVCLWNGKEERHVTFLRRIQLTWERQQGRVVKPQERRQETSRKKDEKTVRQELKCVSQV